MGQLQNNNIPQEVQRLRLVTALSGCGGGVDLCLKESTESEMSVFDDDILRYSDWIIGDANSPKVFVAHNGGHKNLVLLPLDNRIVSGHKVTEGGVADCAILTMSDMSFIEFKTNVVSNSVGNIESKTNDAIKQLWNTFNVIIAPRCAKKGIDISKLVNVEFFIVFNKDLDVTGTMASRLNLQMEFKKNYNYSLFFENEKNF